LKKGRIVNNLKVDANMACTIDFIMRDCENRDKPWSRRAHESTNCTATIEEFMKAHISSDTLNHNSTQI